MRILVNLVGILKEDSQSLYAKSMVLEILRNAPKSHYFVLVSGGNINWVDKLTGDNFKIIKFGFAKGKIKSWLSLQFVVPLIYLKEKINLIYSPSVLSSLFLAHRSVNTVHDFAYLKFRDESSFLARQLMRLSYYFSIKFSKYIVAISNSTLEDIKSIYKRNKNIIVIYNAPIINRIVENNTNENNLKNNSNDYKKFQPYILYIGINRPRKNLRILIEALAEIPNINLIIAGDRLDGTELADLIKNKNLRDRVIELGYVNDDFEKIKLYEQASVFVFPTLYEGFGLPAVESQLLGVPLICSDIPVLREIAGEGALFADSVDPDSFSESIKKVISNKEIKNDLIEKGFENVKRFSWEKSAKELLEIFNMYK